MVFVSFESVNSHAVGLQCVHVGLLLGPSEIDVGGAGSKYRASAFVNDEGMLRTSARFFWSNRTVAMFKPAAGRPLTSSPFFGSDFP